MAEKVMPVNATDVPLHKLPSHGKAEIIKKEAIRWSLFKRINFYVEWIPRIINENDYETGRDYFGGLKGDLITFMITRGYSNDTIERAKRMIRRIEHILDNGVYNYEEKKHMFLKHYKEFVSFLADNGLYLSVRFQKPKTNKEIINAIENMIIYIDEIERDLLQGSEVRDDMSIALQNLITLISTYKTSNSKLAFLKIELINKIKEVKSRIGMVQKDKPTALEIFSRDYSDMMTAINRFLGAIGNENFVETYYKYYAQKTFRVPEKETEKQEIAELFMNVLLEDKNVREFMKNAIKESIEEMAEEEDIEDGVEELEGEDVDEFE